MLDEFVLLHANKAGPVIPPPGRTGLQWKTCLRQVVLLNRRDAAEYERAGVEVYQAERAYSFLLEIVCGLHSPLLGETEVMGQYREFCTRAELPNSYWGQFLRQLISDLLVDAKRIRQQFLQNLGSQSYGSLTRHIFKDFAQLTLIGTGQLAEELLPWLTKQAEVRVCYRNQARADALQRQFPQISLSDLADPQPDSQPDGRTSGLIIAAPLTAQALEAWVRAQNSSFSKTLDLRGESADDPVRLAGELIDLASFFGMLQNDRQRITQRVSAARAAIAQLAQRQLQQFYCRPFGWEDLCA
jgi:glutamyl-tRNA reductase